MKPHSLESVQRVPPSKNARFNALGPIAERHGRFSKGEVLPETRVLACPRVKVADLPDGFIPPRFYQRNLEQNQQIASCCRHPENHYVEAHKTHPDEPVPDIYVFICDQCGRKHRRLLGGQYENEARPIWKAD